MMSKARVPINLRRSIALNHFADKSWLQLGPIKDEGGVQLLQFPEKNFNQEKFALSDESAISFKPMHDDKEKYAGFNYYKKEFNSKSESNAYLHFKRSRYSSHYNALRIWFNGNLMEDTVARSGKDSSQILKLPLRKGKNTILIKYTYEQHAPMSFKLGDVYGGDLSYIFD